MIRHQVVIKREARRSLALKVTPDGVAVHIPRELDADSPRVQDFIAAGLEKLPQAPDPPGEPLSRDDLHQRVAAWAERLDVAITRIQIRHMRTKWASCSTAGTLTLADDVLQLPLDLVDYIICHELLHIKLPDHNKGFRAMLASYIPDWRQRERRLAGWVLYVRESDRP